MRLITAKIAFYDNFYTKQTESVQKSIRSSDLDGWPGECED